MQNSVYTYETSERTDKLDERFADKEKRFGKLCVSCHTHSHAS